MSSDQGDLDAVVVGGGHNGLVAACYFAKAGLRVTVVEAQEYLGGMAASQPFIASAPDHVVSPGAYESVLLRQSPIVHDLQLARFGYLEIDSLGYLWLGDDGASLFLQRDVAATARDIARFSAADAARYVDVVAVGRKAFALQSKYALDSPRRPSLATLAAAARHVASDRHFRALLPAIATTSAVDAITGMFESRELRAALLSMTSILTSPTLEGSAVSVFGTAPIHDGRCARPVGGMGGLIAALERCLLDAGGAIRTSSRVVAIHRSNARASAVELEDGTVLNARHAVITACPVQLVAELVDGLSPSVASQLRNAPANAAGVGSMTVNLALDRHLRYPGHQPGRPDIDLRMAGIFTGSTESVLEAHEASARGELPRSMPWWGAAFSALDPTQAPSGQETVQLFSPVPVRPVGEWASARSTAADQLVKHAAEFAPGLAEGELGRYVETPEDLSARTGASNGCYYHVDMVPLTRLGPLRPAWGLSAYRLPHEGLYISGAGTHPSGGVSGLPGMHAARAVLADR